MSERSSTSPQKVVDIARATLDATVKKANPINIPVLSEGASYAEKCKAFNDAIAELSSCRLSDSLTDDEVAKFIEFFKGLYQQDAFRHRYSDVCGVMFGYLNGGDDDKLDEVVPFQAEALSNNIVILERAAEERGVDKCVLGCIRKLHDHVDLEINRIKYMAQQNKTLYAQDEELKRALFQKIEDAVADASSSFDEKVDRDIRDVQERLQRNYVTILGIFAAIVIAFMSGSMFSSAVLQGINDASIYRLSFVILLLGFVLFNLMSGLFAFLGKLTGKWSDWISHLIVEVDVALGLFMVINVALRWFRVFG